ncbi:MAG: ATP-grasp domain-containing protein [Candidatus Aureabacteria bacterium]|nr:ATP-grasp domain-containing protein [Candidatus Auribacterota bacterium]
MPSSDNFSVLIPDGNNDISLFVVRCLSQIPNLKIHVMSEKSYAPIRFSRHITSFHVEKVDYNTEKHLDVICHYMKKTKADILLPVKFSMTRYLSHHFQKLSKQITITPITNINTFNIVNNKWLLAEFLKRHGFPHPDTILYCSEENYENSIQNLSFPVLVKPIFGDSGKGIYLFDDRSKLLSFLEANIDQSQQIIIQNCIRGIDIGCSVLCSDGKILAYTIQKGMASTGIKFSSLSEIDLIKKENVFKIIEKLMSILKWNGIAHIDMLYDEKENSAKIIEINPRYWASLMGSFSAGVNFPYLSCLAGLGFSFPKPDYYLDHFIVSGKATIKHAIKYYFKKSKIDFSWKKTSLKYGMADPLAELFLMLERHSQIYRKFILKK